MNIRELIRERILFALDDGLLSQRFAVTAEELDDLSDLDLLELYEDIYLPEAA